jgi:NADPH:quinone reductase-like Zn-dependent oxidoreductase
MATMKAMYLTAFGGPEILQVCEIDRPQPKDNEVLIQVRAASVNPIDYQIRSGHYPPVKQDQLPLVLGRDVAGTVVACGAEVMNFEEGDEVYAMLDSGTGGYAEYATVSADLCASKPIQLDHAEAAAVPLAALTAWQGLFDHGHLSGGQRVLIHGGAGGVGHFAIQFAKAHDALVATTVSARDTQFVRSLGADRAIDYRNERFEEVLPEVDLVFDLVGGDTQERSWQILKDGGTLISTLAKPSGRQALAHHAHATHYVAQPNGTELSAIRRLIDDGKVRPHIERTFALQDAAAAQQVLEREHVQGKIVLAVGA